MLGVEKMASQSVGEKEQPLLEGDITEQMVSFDRMEVSASNFVGAAHDTVFSTLSTYWRIAAKTFAKACGVAIGWSWSVAIQTSFSEKLVPEELNTFAGLLYACSISFLTAWMIMWITKHQQDPNDVEFGKFGRNSRELLLVVQPMVLAWAWKDCLRGLLWEHLPDDEPMQLFYYRLGFAVSATVILAVAVHWMGGKVRQAQEDNADAASQTYSVVLMSMLSASFGLFLAWCWNETAATFSGVLYPHSETSEGVTLCTYAAILTLVATLGTMKLGNMAQELRDAQASATGAVPLFNSQVPLWAKFIDLISASLGYMVGWAWSDAAMTLFLHSFAVSDVGALYGLYAVTVTVVAVLYTSHVATLLDQAETPAGVKQYATLLLNALGFMVGWSWKAYMQFFVQMLPKGSEIFADYFQAITATIIACVIYHKLRIWEAQSTNADVEKHIIKMTEAAGDGLD